MAACRLTKPRTQKAAQPVTLDALDIPVWYQRPGGSLESFWCLVYIGKPKTLGWGAGRSIGWPQM